MTETAPRHATAMAMVAMTGVEIGTETATAAGVGVGVTDPADRLPEAMVLATDRCLYCGAVHKKGCLGHPFDFLLV